MAERAPSRLIGKTLAGEESSVWLPDHREAHSEVITESFITRYQHTLFQPARDTGRLHPELARVLRQLAQVLIEDLVVLFGRQDWILDKVAHQLERETGHRGLLEALGSPDAALEFLSATYDLWNDDHHTPDYFVKLRLSAMELLLREAYQRSHGGEFKPPPQRIRFRGGGTKTVGAPPRDLVSSVTDEMNARLRRAGVPLRYDNGFLHLAADDPIAEEVEAPFWKLLHQGRWSNVEKDMKQALEVRDASGPNPTFFAMRALESTIKIICAELACTTGKERGAANYIDSLVSERSGRFIAVWEGEALKHLFRHVRNPQGHGPGDQDPPVFTPQQVDWVIESAMSWVKSLVVRS